MSHGYDVFEAIDLAHYFLETPPDSKVPAIADKGWNSAREQIRRQYASEESHVIYQRAAVPRASVRAA